MHAPELEIREISGQDIPEVAAFFTAELNGRVTPSEWARLLDPPWAPTGPNRGFQLRAAGRIVGAYAAVYSERIIRGEHIRFCNLAAFCVVDGYRAHSFRLLRAMLAQREFEFSDLSPSGNVVGLNERMGFKRLDTTTRLAMNLPALPRRGVTVTSKPDDLEAALRDADARIYADHRRARACKHLLITSEDRYCYLIFRKDRRKGVPLFATPLYAGGDLPLMWRNWSAIASHLLMRHGLPVTLAERRVLQFLPPRSVRAGSRIKMYRSKKLLEDDVDYLYSEMTLVEW